MIFLMLGGTKGEQESLRASRWRVSVTVNSHWFLGICFRQLLPLMFLHCLVIGTMISPNHNKLPSLDQNCYNVSSSPNLRSLLPIRECSCHIVLSSSLLSDQHRNLLLQRSSLLSLLLQLLLDATLNSQLYKKLILTFCDGRSQFLLTGSF